MLHLLGELRAAHPLDDAHIVVQCGRSSPAASLQPIANSFVERYNSACDADNYEEAEAVLGEILGVIVKIGGPVFDDLAPPLSSAAAGLHNLHTLLFAEQYTVYRRGLHDNAKLLYEGNYAGENNVADSPFSVFQLSIAKSCDLPRYSTTDILVIENLRGNSDVSLVTVDGQSMCSQTGNIYRGNAAQREPDCLWKVTTSDVGTTVRVPKLLGLIEIPDGKRVVGFLEGYIPVSDSWELSTLGHIEVVLGIAEARRKKWASQVQEIVRLLHQIGIIWGGGSASNILIHSDSDDAWVIDFGGGRTGSWLDWKVALDALASRQGIYSTGCSYEWELLESACTQNWSLCMDWA